jgi:DNA repair protein RadA/Sms
MRRERVRYQCRECGAPAPQWAGRCGQCGEWNALEELTPSGPPRPASSAVPLASVPADAGMMKPTGLAELDRVLGGGIVPSSMTLIAGEPGIGKSTLLLQAVASMGRAGMRCLLVSAEESPAQVRLRASRLGIGDDGVFVSGDTDLGSIRRGIADTSPDVVVIDSIQTIGDHGVGLQPGTLSAVRGCAQGLAEQARADGPAMFLVGHVTKDGAIAGPRVLEHLVDTVLSFEGDRHYALRMLRAVKHRFGPVGELGLWEMTGDGLTEVADGTSFLLADRRPDTPGSAVFAGIEGRRPLLVEVQALVSPPGAPSSAGGARRSANRFEPGRLAQLLAVLDCRVGLGTRDRDVYVSAVGGVRIADPGADLAVAAAVSSAATGHLTPEDTVLIGEIGLGGELRQVAHSGRRLAEAARMGFRRAIVPHGTEEVDGMASRPVGNLAHALDLLLTRRPADRPRLRVLDGVSRAAQGE